MATPVIGIKQIWYGPVITSTLANAAAVTTLINGDESGFEEVQNSHQDTWSYEQEDPEVTDYVNELSGNPYYRDMTARGARRIKFTMGEYDMKHKAALQGGTASGDDWTDATGDNKFKTADQMNKSVIGLTKTGYYIVFTKASIVAKTEAQEKALGLGVTATAMDNFQGTSEIPSEYWFKKTT